MPDDICLLRQLWKNKFKISTKKVKMCKIKAFRRPGTISLAGRDEAILILILIYIDLFSPNGALWVKTNHIICLGYITHDLCFSLDNQLAITYNTYDTEFQALLLICCS